MPSNASPTVQGVGRRFCSGNLSRSPKVTATACLLKVPTKDCSSGLANHFFSPPNSKSRIMLQGLSRNIEEQLPLLARCVSMRDRPEGHPMIIKLLVITFLLSLIVASLVAWFFRKSISAIMSRVVGEPLSSAWVRYMTVAIVVVGVAGGVRPWDYEKYITPAKDQPILVSEFRPLDSRALPHSDRNRTSRNLDAARVLRLRAHRLCARAGCRVKTWQGAIVGGKCLSFQISVKAKAARRSWPALRL